MIEPVICGTYTRCNMDEAGPIILSRAPQTEKHDGAVLVPLWKSSTLSPAPYCRGRATAVKLLTDRESEVGVHTTQHLSARSAIW